MIGTEFVPKEDRAEFHVLVDLPPGTSFDESVARVAAIEREIRRTPEVRAGLQHGRACAARSGRRSCRCKTTPKAGRKRSIQSIKAEVRERLRQLPFVEAKVADPPMMQGTPYQPPINLYVRGDDMAELQRVNDELLTRAEKGARRGGRRQLARHRASRRWWRASTAISPPTSASRWAASPGSCAAWSRASCATKLRDGDRQHDIRVRLAPEFRNDFAAHRPDAALFASRARSSARPTSSRMEPALGPSSIDARAAPPAGEDRHRSRRPRRSATSRPTSTKVVSSVTMPPNFEYGFAGDVELMQESAPALLLAMMLAVAFIYIVLASQFESFLEPMLIMLSLPLAIVGALLLLLVTGHHLGMPAMIGIVMLMGLVTKNAILLVDYTNQLHREEGLPVRDALLKAGPVRLRPIVMTTLAMILGMLPSAMGRGEGGEFRAPISVATIGGLITSTLLTLVVVPVSYLLLARFLALAEGVARASGGGGCPAPCASTGTVIARAAASAGCWPRRTRSGRLAAS